MKKVGRNDPCPCGSGKKYKQCCMQRDPAQAARRSAAHDSASGQVGLAQAHHQAGHWRQAEALHRRILEVDPANASTHTNLGSALQGLGRLDEAVASYQEALRLRPGFAEAHYNLGNALKEQGKLDQAAASYRNALSFKPNLAEAHSNLGTALRQLGQLEDAAASYRKALSIRPDYAPAHTNLGNVFRRLGQTDAALASYLRALEIEEVSEAKLGFAACLKNGQFTRDNAAVRRLLIRALSEPWGRPQELASASTALVKLNANVGECVERASRAWPARLPGRELYGPSGAAPVAGDALLRCLLETTPSVDIDLERFLTQARFALLDAASASAESDESSEEVLVFHCSLARQCFINEYVFACTDAELERARSLKERLAASLASGSRIPVLLPIAVAAYFPLGSIPSAEALLERSWPEPVTGLFVQQVREPLEELQHRAAIRRLTAIEDKVSRMVRQQYEESPYPRWVKTPTLGTAVSIDAYLRQQFPSAQFAPLERSGDLGILIAGCGTGRETIEMARRFTSCRVLSVDLSLNSLSYAMRKTRELGIQNVEYAQADIMKLGAIGRTFDVVSSVGVLHHLGDPVEGWRVLLSLLRPGGFMRLGLYSELGRQQVVAAREFVSRRGYDASPENIRRCRQELVSLKGELKLDQLLVSPDFFGTSQCRDLIFHVHEQRFTLDRIARYLEELGLTFIGFTLEPQVAQRYLERFPEDGTMIDLDCWRAFETENPDTFSGMYQFWAQRPA
jgi:Flp pilus assembly protein TadD/SAM-dependent methyltransferase